MRHASRPVQFWGREDIGIALAIVLLAIAASVWLGGDGSPDFRIYHLYNGYAALTGGRPQDIAAAQMQSYFFPGLDIPYYWFTAKLDSSPRLLLAVLSLPYAVAGFCVYGLIKAALPEDWPGRRSLALLTSVFGLAGSASLPTLGTSMSDIVPGSFILFALCIYLYMQDRNKPDNAALFAGLCCGISVGFKLTAAPFFIGFLVGILAYERIRDGKPFRRFILFGMAGGAAVLLVCGGWWWRNYAMFGNPLFPAFNDIFKSDFVEWGRWSDDRFKPRDLLMALFYPFYWAFRPSQLAIELNTRDARMAVVYVSVLVLFAMALTSSFRRILTQRAQFFYIFVPVFGAVAFIFWERLLSIYRYLAVLESLAGLILLLALLPAARLLSRRGVNAVVILAMALISGTTAYPWWSRSSSASNAVVITGLPIVEPRSMAIFLDAYAMSYLAPSMPADMRFIGANNNLVHLGDKGQLQAQVESAIRSHQGQLWGIEYPPAFAGMADDTLKYYGLERVQPCSEIKSNIEEGAIRMCKLAPALNTTR